MSSRKSWNRTKGNHLRKVNVRDTRKKFLIVCEGTKTEPNYFKCFRVNRDVVKLDIEGFGYNTLTLVREAIRIKETVYYDEVWCVFDRDSFSAQSFNAAFKVARENDIKIAYSNQAFELWYLLHFHYYDVAIHRKEYCKMLTQLLGHKYEKNSETIYDELLSRQKDAIRHAERLHSNYNLTKPERDNPSTTVHELVKKLNEYSN